MENIVAIAKVLSDTNRIKILALLLEHNEICVCEICDTLELSQPLVSRHLKQMKDAGIITSQQEGKWMLYRLNISNHNDMLVCSINVLKKQKLTLPNIVKCKR